MQTLRNTIAAACIPSLEYNAHLYFSAPTHHRPFGFSESNWMVTGPYMSTDLTVALCGTHN